MHDTKKRGIEVGDVKINLKQMMSAKSNSVDGLTKGVEFLFKKNNVDYIKGSGSFAGEHEVKVQLNDGGERTVRGKNIIIATGSESTPFPGLEIDEKKVISSTGAIALEEVPKKMVVIGGGIIGLEMVRCPPKKPLTRALSHCDTRRQYGPDLDRRSLWSSSWEPLAVLAWTRKSRSRRRRFLPNRA